MRNQDTAILSVRINKVTKQWIQDISKEHGYAIYNFFDDLYESFKSGMIRYENRTFHGEEEFERAEYEMKVADLMTEVNELKAKLREEPTKRELENFPEKEKEPIKHEQPMNDSGLNLDMVYELAEKHRITPQSLLDMALRPYR